MLRIFISDVLFMHRAFAGTRISLSSPFNAILVKANHVKCGIIRGGYIAFPQLICAYQYFIQYDVKEHYPYFTVYIFFLFSYHNYQEFSLVSKEN